MKFFPSYLSKISKRGFTLIDAVIGVAVLVLLFGGIFMVYFSVIDLINNLDLRTAAASALNRQMEIIRNLPYDSVGTVNGIPPGVIPQSQFVSEGDLSFNLKTYIRNIDDPFDGTLGGNPNDTAPADYKLVEIEASCGNCTRFVPLIMTATVAPKNLESASNNGSLFVNVFDANGLPVSQAAVHVVNTNVTPAIDLTDATNLTGVLQLVGVPTSTQSYQIEVSKTGYSSDKTYPVGGISNPNPLKPSATVAAQTVTTISFAIDKISSLSVRTQNFTCGAISNADFSIVGSKLIGNNPDVLKFSTSSRTDANGNKIFPGLEWDTYSLTLSEAGLDILGTMPLSPLSVQPSSSPSFTFVLMPALPRSLLVTARDAGSGAGILNATMKLQKTGYLKTLIAGRNHLSYTDWSGGQFADQGGIAVDSPMGSLTLEASASSTYSTSTVGWLVSNTIDIGSSSSTVYGIDWTPVTQPSQTGSDSLRIQLASNNDNSTWNFVGPDGSASTYYSVNSSTINSIHNNNRYLRYKVYLSTEDENYTPQLDDLSFEFSSACMPQSQVLFNNLGSGDYSLTVDAPGYAEATSSISIIGNWQQVEIPMTAN